MSEYQEKTEKANILIVDDVVPNLVILEEMIRKAGYNARPVTSVVQAEKAMAKGLPQLILLDISMPETDGFEWCQVLKRNPKTRDIPIIFISGLNSSKDKIEGFQLGAVDFISKPFEIEEVTQRVNTHLKIYQMQQELELYNSKLHKLVDEQANKIVMEQKNLIYAMAHISEAKDGANRNHIDNVAGNSRLLALCLLLSEEGNEVITNEFVETIEMASPLHDIGKTGIPYEILIKGEQRSPEEESVYQSHTNAGAQMLSVAYDYNKENEFLHMAIDIAHYHHEKWDGTGFPEKKAGMDIPLPARIVSITNSYDHLIARAMEHMDDYDKAQEEAIRQIQEESGRSFEPMLVDLFVRIRRQLRR